MGHTRICYDGNGNEAGNSAGLSLAYNAQDQTTSATPPGGSAASYSYTDAGQTQRVSAGSTAFQYDVTSLRAMTTVNGLYVVPPAPWHSDIRSTSYQ